MKTVIGKTKAWLTEFSDPTCLSSDDNDYIMRNISFSTHDMSTSGWTYVGDAEITMNIIDNNSVIKNKVDALEKSIIKIQADSEYQINDIRGKINQLLAITYVPDSE